MSSHFKVDDPNGTWFKSLAYFPLIDPNSLTRFNAGVLTKAANTSWTKAQVEAKVLLVVDDPLKETQLPTSSPQKVPVAAAAQKSDKLS